MKIQIKTANIDLTDAIEEYVNEKLTYLEKLVDSNDESVHCNVEIGLISKHHQSGDIFKAEVNMHTAGHDYHSVVEKEDLYIAITSVRDELSNSIKQFRDKQQTLKRRGATSIKKRLKGFKNPDF